MYDREIGRRLALPIPTAVRVDEGPRSGVPSVRADSSGSAHACLAFRCGSKFLDDRVRAVVVVDVVVLGMQVALEDPVLDLQSPDNPRAEVIIGAQEMQSPKPSE